MAFESYTYTALDCSAATQMASRLNGMSLIKLRGLFSFCCHSPADTDSGAAPMRTLKKCGMKCLFFICL